MRAFPEVHLCQRYSGRWVGTVTSGSFLITLYRGGSETVFSGELITVEITGWRSRQSCCEGSLPLSHKLPLLAATPTRTCCSRAQDSQTASAPSCNYLLSHQTEQEAREGNDHRDKPLCSQDSRNPWEPPHLKSVTHGPEWRTSDTSAFCSLNPGAQRGREESWGFREQERQDLSACCL